MKTYEIDVKGMSCGHCVARVEAALAPLSVTAAVNLEKGLATVETDRAPDALLEALDEIGYPGTLRE